MQTLAPRQIKWMQMSDETMYISNQQSTSPFKKGLDVNAKRPSVQDTF